MKKLLSIVIVLIMVLSVFGSAAAQPAKEKRSSGDSLEDAEILLFIPAGENEDEVGYLAKDEWSEGPEAFVVEGDKVCILDSVKRRIIIINKTDTAYVDLSGCSYPTHFCKMGNVFYVASVDDDNLHVYTENGGAIGNIALPGKLEYINIYALRNYGGELQLVTDDLECYIYNSVNETWEYDFTIVSANGFASQKTFISGNTKVTADIGENTLAQFVKATEDELFVGVYEFVPYYPVIETEYTLRKYDLNGNLLGCTVIDYSRAYSVPQSAVYINSDDEVYTMMCRDEGVYITKPNLRTEYDSHMDELTRIAEELTEEALKNQTRTGSITTKTRSQVETRAYNAVHHAWEIVDTGNITAPTGATLPGYIADSQLHDHMEGIPYCWGRYYNYLSSFDGKIEDGYAAGNTTHQNIGGTAGLDCSGFVSYAYLLGSHHSTSELIDEGVFVCAYQVGNNNCSIANLLKMDFMIKHTGGRASNHVVLYDLYQPENGNTTEKFKIYESTTNNGIEKTTHRYVDPLYLQNYYLKSPYGCGGINPCLYSDHYEYNQTKHWLLCDYNCGSKSGAVFHTLILSPDGDSQCPICGYSSN